MKNDRLFMETTKIPPEKTCAQISILLVEAGATRIMQEFGPGRTLDRVTFALEVEGREIPYVLPVRTERVFQRLQERRKENLRERAVDQDREQSVRVAWRQLLRWVEAQLALIDTGMVKAQEVFLPYVRMGNDQTYFEQIEAKYSKMLGMDAK